MKSLCHHHRVHPTDTHTQHIKNVSYCAQLLKKLFIFDNNLDMLLSFLVLYMHIHRAIHSIFCWSAEYWDMFIYIYVYFYVFQIPNANPNALICNIAADIWCSVNGKEKLKPTEELTVTGSGGHMFSYILTWPVNMKNHEIKSQIIRMQRCNCDRVNLNVRFHNWF